jgi:4-amino-4-deoxy-L-arabinose transferase-like glycosyltransferase
MNEPSVLDFVKSIFKSWTAFTAFLEAVFRRKDAAMVMEAIPPAAPLAQPAAQAPAFDLRGFPWLILLVLLLALAGQRTFEPPRQRYPVGIILYPSALGLTILAFRRGAWNLSPLPKDETAIDPLSIRVGALIISGILTGAAFLAMGGNRFTAANLTLWLGAIAFFILAFWIRAPRTFEPLKWSLREFLAREAWTIRVTRWGLAILFVAAISIFFRTYRLDLVAPEMTSDHAEKLTDVYDITQGIYPIYFPRNTGREPLYIYLCALASNWFGFSFLTLKAVSVLGGLATLPYLYWLGREMGSARIGLLAAAFAGFGYWPAVIERFGLRISFYPLFAAATLFYFMRGLRRQSRNDMILAGVALGLGLHGYTPFRIMPFVLVVLFAAYFLHLRDAQTRKQTLIWFALLALAAWVLIVPLARFGLDRPDIITERAFSRIGTTERPFPAPVWQVFLSNLWISLKEFNWDNGGIWVHSVTGRPALDVVSAALFLIGATLVTVRYLRERHWKDLLLLLAVPLLQMPSTLSLAFPGENPSLNRAGGALVPAFLLAGIGLEAVVTSIAGRSDRGGNGSAAGRTPARLLIATVVFLGLALASFSQNFDLIFVQYYKQYRHSAWNSSDMGAVIGKFIEAGGPAENAWIVPYPHWVDTRLAPFIVGLPGRDFAIPRDRLAETLNSPGEKLFLFILKDEDTKQALWQLYPHGSLGIFESSVEGKSFYIFRVPAG